MVHTRALALLCILWSRVAAKQTLRAPEFGLKRERHFDNISDDFWAFAWFYRMSKTLREMVIVISILLAGCNGGGGSSGAPTATPTPTLARAPSPIPTASRSISPGPTIASWKGDVTFNSQSGPNSPLSFISEPGDFAGSYTKGSPIT